MSKCERVKSEAAANVVVVVLATGWKGDKMKEKTLTGFYRCDDDARHEVLNCGWQHEAIVDQLFKEFEQSRPESESWSVSETWGRPAKRAGK